MTQDDYPEFVRLFARTAEMISATVSDPQIEGTFQILSPNDPCVVFTALDRIMQTWTRNVMPTPGQWLKTIVELREEQTRQPLLTVGRPSGATECDDCQDTGMQSFWCPGDDWHRQCDPDPWKGRAVRTCSAQHYPRAPWTGGRPSRHAVAEKTRIIALDDAPIETAIWEGHDYVMACPCRETNTRYQRDRAQFVAARQRTAARRKGRYADD